MSRSLVRVVVLLTVLAAVAPAAVGTASAQNVTLTLTTVDQQGNPVGNVDLRITWNESGGPKDVTTRSNGKVFVDVPKGADVTIEVTDDTYLRNFPRRASNVEGQQIQVPVSLPGTAEVTVVDEDGLVGNAEVRLSGNGADITQSTASNGTTTIGPVERGTYALDVGKSGYLTNTTQIAVTGDVNTTVRIREADRQLSFTVVDDHFSPPQTVPNASIEVEGVGTFTTGSNGQRGVTVSVNREYRVTVSKADYESVTRTISVAESDKQVTATIQRADDLSVDATSDRVVIGESTSVTVTDEYGDPVEGATVSVGGSEVGQTGPDGTATVPIESRGNQTIEVSQGGVSASVVVEGIQPAGPETPTPTETQTETQTPAAETTEGGGGPGFGVLGVIAALAAVLTLRREI